MSSFLFIYIYKQSAHLTHLPQLEFTGQFTDFSVLLLIVISNKFKINVEIQKT